jgi:hypothetical protein
MFLQCWVIHLPQTMCCEALWGWNSKPLLSSRDGVSGEWDEGGRKGGRQEGKILGQKRGMKNPWAWEEDGFLVHSQNGLNDLILDWCICRNLNLGLATKTKACKGVGQEGSSGVWESVRTNIHTPKWTPILRVGVPWTSESLKNDFKGQNPLDLGVPYIIEKLLELRCLKWSRMAHLDI